jgi:hypothetical protein
MQWTIAAGFDRQPVTKLTGRRETTLSSPCRDPQGRTMAKRPRTKSLRNRGSIATRKRWQPFRSVEPWPNASDAIAALARAWIVAMIATTLLGVALAIAPLWDRAIFMQALRDALSTDLETAQPADEAPADPRLAPELPRKLTIANGE